MAVVKPMIRFSLLNPRAYVSTIEIFTLVTLTNITKSSNLLEHLLTVQTFSYLLVEDGKCVPCPLVLMVSGARYLYIFQDIGKSS